MNGATAAKPVDVGNTIDRDSLTQAWGDGVLHNLPAFVKALYSAGRFVAVDDSGVQFALPNAAHRDRCMELAPQVEAALAARFETPVRLVLVVEGSPGTPSPNGAHRDPPVRSGPAAAEPDEFEDEDPEELAAAPTTEDHQASAVDRLLQAFPGASEIAE
jgi:hypothetical protein